MLNPEIAERGARALYLAEHGYRTAEFRKETDGASRVEADFQAHRTRYLQKFEDLVTSLNAQGLVLQPRTPG